jgi:FtsH-binding integral membrane protein
MALRDPRTATGVHTNHRVRAGFVHSGAMTEPDEPPTTLSYRTPDGDRPPVPAAEHSSPVGQGFLAAFAAAVALVVSLVTGRLSGDRAMLAAAAVTAVIVGIGVFRGIRERDWGFLIGVGLFALMAVIFLVPMCFAGK